MSADVCFVFFSLLFWLQKLGLCVLYCSPSTCLLTWSPGGIRLQSKDPTVASRVTSSALAAPVCTFSACGEPSPPNLEKTIHSSLIQSVHSALDMLAVFLENTASHVGIVCPNTSGIHGCPELSIVFLCAASLTSY